MPAPVNVSETNVNPTAAAFIATVCTLVITPSLPSLSTALLNLLVEHLPSPACHWPARAKWMV
jgi:hypothetical protein